MHWADIIDGALFLDAQSAVELAAPAMKLMMVIEGIRDPNRTAGLIEAFQEKSLERNHGHGLGAEAFRRFYDRHDKSVDIIRNHASLRPRDGLLRHQRLRRHGRVQQVHPLLSVSRGHLLRRGQPIEFPFQDFGGIQSLEPSAAHAQSRGALRAAWRRRASGGRRDFLCSRKNSPRLASLPRKSPANCAVITDPEGARPGRKNRVASAWPGPGGLVAGTPRDG